ncbi:DUF4892 domain-containing protein [Rhizobium sp. VS19-DR104.2]|uniref:OmpA family protein n=1 Tax=unclassified Rhizobium TaxID=2613769 RepID=UPI001C5B4588|nr:MULTISPECIES: OmpA family protein [unclassified Rhizobium]MBZ5763069.1 DUF4892 domain-containing protein [Rhizobium sp. VS19-DR96]MBZ5768945.1 DUF4892 domain-containing protein [Rhizobium sp. VS19-DR129.2]MBZ5776563.1 DUF4892 domain-containing protein [Rhizobium sp. VS19-DRK62.2]MBZ5787698.1 DUF4892 domain-containing protein [Rhizobium sp. VS19-DR121]MBZ5805071.1 DUF4892 domain-containing protein [Rhizobium sp. VS19-DR181]
MSGFRTGLATISLIAVTGLFTFAAAETPTQDIKGGKDNPIVSRFVGATIIGYRQQDYAAVTLPLGPYDASQKNRFAKSQAAEGRLTSIAYAVPEGKTALEVYRNYEQTLSAAGFQPSYQCEGETCGGYDFAAALVDPVNQAMGSSLFNLRIDLLNATNGDVRAMTARLDRVEGPVDVSVLVSQDSGKQVGVLLQVVEGREMQKNQVTVDAKAMSDGLGKAGHIALNGIQFETGSATLKPESDKTLAQMAEMLVRDATRKVYIVGHTDSSGAIEHNIELSQARAAAVVKALTDKFGIDASRLSAQGVGPYAPVASNLSDAGRAKNRRVELVEK